MNGFGRDVFVFFCRAARRAVGRAGGAGLLTHTYRRGGNRAIQPPGMSGHGPTVRAHAAEVFRCGSRPCIFDTIG